MKALIINLYNDQAGFIVSAELVLISTISVLGVVVGLSELASAVNQELEDVASAFGSFNQTFSFYGYEGHTGQTVGSLFDDAFDRCDDDCDIVGHHPEPEGGH